MENKLQNITTAFGCAMIFVSLMSCTKLQSSGKLASGTASTCKNLIISTESTQLRLDSSPMQIAVTAEYISSSRETVTERANLSSSDETIAKVTSSNGIYYITPVGKSGTVEILASFKGKNTKYEMTVGSKTSETPSPTPTSSPSPSPSSPLPAPTVTSISPSSGNWHGGTSVVITGTGFVSGVLVSIGGSSCTPVTYTSTTSLTCTTTTHTAAVTDVIVANPDAQTGRLTNGFTYNSFAYVSNTNANVIGAYVVNPSTGVLTTVPGSPFATGSSAFASWNNPYYMVVHPSGKFLYYGLVFGQLGSFEIDTATGALTPLTGGVYSVAASVVKPIIDPTGKFLFIADGANQIYAFSINNSTGALTAVSGSPFTVAGANHLGVGTFAPSGKFFLMTNYWGGSVGVFSFNETTGAVSQVAGSPFSIPQYNHTPTFDPAGKFVYFGTNYSSPATTGVSEFNSITGALTPIVGSPFASTAVGSNNIVFSADGKFAYTSRYSTTQMVVYSVDPVTGLFSQLSGSPFNIGVAPYNIAFDPTTKYLFCPSTTGGGTIGAVSVYSRDETTGVLTAVAGSPFTVSTGNGSFHVAFW